ncbi:DUF3006 domain-containing protein [Oceanobacillus halophilus]|uniref:DUF3006 domain-containing protein n=1 Tax=Oceanobacillus halophilus TaxID=930130 RepID=A0A495A7S1_9BACI|nr:DUF3006 domain-containing protein [Oceanobacillus halophilus]RKQ35830.1 DUF3006 domain-containing protein [Oceanobacillus halophilus]
MERIKNMFAVLLLFIVSLSFLLFIIQLLDQLEQKSFHKIQVKGVLDRFENNHAVILLEKINEEITLPMEVLPKGSKQHTWFDIIVTKKGYKILSVNQEKAEKQQIRRKQLLERLRE